jgi:hypothetical protein
MIYVPFLLIFETIAPPASLLQTTFLAFQVLIDNHGFNLLVSSYFRTRQIGRTVLIRYQDV